MMLVFGVVGYVFKKLNYPLAPLVLALVLGDKAEEAFRQSMLLSQGSVAIFWSNGLVGTIMALGLVLCSGRRSRSASTGSSAAAAAARSLKRPPTAYGRVAGPWYT